MPLRLNNAKELFEKDLAKDFNERAKLKEFGFEVVVINGVTITAIGERQVLFVKEDRTMIRMKWRTIKERIKKFHCDVWIPFTKNKRRILILAIASYIALC